MVLICEGFHAGPLLSLLPVIRGIIDNLLARFCRGCFSRFFVDCYLCPASASLVSSLCLLSNEPDISICMVETYPIWNQSGCNISPGTHWKTGDISLGALQNNPGCFVVILLLRAYVNDDVYAMSKVPRMMTMTEGYRIERGHMVIS